MVESEWLHECLFTEDWDVKMKRSPVIALATLVARNLTLSGTVGYVVAIWRSAFFSMSKQSSQRSEFGLL